MTVSGSFTALGVSKALLVRAGETAAYSSTVDTLETFTGLAVFQRSRDGGLTWQTVATVDGRTVAVAAGTTSGTVANETKQVEHYRWQCLAAGDADELDYTVADVVDVEAYRDTKAGVRAISYNDDGSVTIASIANFDALLQAWAATLPTSDPAVAGAFYLLVGVLKVSAGA